MNHPRLNDLLAEATDFLAQQATPLPSDAFFTHFWRACLRQPPRSNFDRPEFAFRGQLLANGRLLPLHLTVTYLLPPASIVRAAETEPAVNRVRLLGEASIAVEDWLRALHFLPGALDLRFGNFPITDADVRQLADLRRMRFALRSRSDGTRFVHAASFRSPREEAGSFREVWPLTPAEALWCARARDYSLEGADYPDPDRRQPRVNVRVCATRLTESVRVDARLNATVGVGLSDRYRADWENFLIPIFQGAGITGLLLQPFEAAG